MSRSSESSEDAAPDIRFGLLRTQLLLTGLLLGLLGGLVYNSLHLAEQRAAETTFRLTSETSNANVVFTQKESTNFALAVERWLGQSATRRQVQIARALLAQRLKVKDDSGQSSMAQVTPEYLEALSALDRSIAAEASGYIADDREREVRDNVRPFLDAFTTESRNLLTTYQRDADANYRTLQVAILQADRIQTYLTLSFFGGLLILVFWVAGTTRDRFRDARRRIRDDAAQLEDARRRVEQAASLDRGQARVLERIATGAPLTLVYRLIVDLAHDAGHAHVRIEIDSDDVVACCGKRPVAGSWTIGFGHQANGQMGLVRVFTATQMAISPSQIEIARRCADLATIAVERQAIEDQLKQQASYDPLTGLANRTLLLSRLEAALHRASRNGHVAVLFCDLDRFKQVNDSMGHDAGDALLREASRRLLSVVRTTDTVARLGGDEFVLLCEGLTGPEWAEELAQRVQETLVAPFHIEGAEVYVDVSIGIAHATPDSVVTAAALIRNADVAMYHAKTMDQQRWASFDASLAEAAAARLHLDSALRHAIARDELVLHFQPIVEITTSRRVGFESLLRWQHPELGLLEPAQFLPIAEQTGLISELGHWVLHHAADQVRRLQAAHEAAFVTVNVSARQLRDAGFVAGVLSVLHAHDLPPHSLVLEVTEDTLVTDAVARDVLAVLRAHGVQVALDDFGTGYSSLTQLQTLQVDVLKLDRSFTAPLASGDPRDIAILEAVVSLARALGLMLIVEGVETHAEASALVGLGVTYGQGYVFGRPEPLPAAGAGFPAPTDGTVSAARG